MNDVSFLFLNNASEFCANNPEIPALVITSYLFMVVLYLNDEVMRKRFFAIWNLFICLFSIMGCIIVNRYVYDNIISKGIVKSLFIPPVTYPYDVGKWISLFAFSKFIELGDTVFLVVRRKKLIFLHWYHHSTVLLFCWYALARRVPFTIHFAGMNYFVHSIMYLYYFCTNIGLYHVVSHVAFLITLLQVTQMVLGIGIVSITYLHRKSYPELNLDTALFWAFAMYFSYFLLFAGFFVKRYMKKPKKE